MKVSIEILYHFRCDSCQGWWSVADRAPLHRAIVHCPHCGHQNAIEGFQDGSQKDVCGVNFIPADVLMDGDIQEAMNVLSNPDAYSSVKVEWASGIQQQWQRVPVWEGGERP